MKKLFVLLFMFAGAVFSNPSFAWIQHNGVIIKGLYQFEGGISRDYTILEFSNNGSRCRVPHTDKELYSLVLSLYMAEKTVSVVCYPTEDDPGGSTFPSHKLHRIRAQ